jgi:hypothetical protein
MRFDQSETFTGAVILPPATLAADSTLVSVDLGIVQSATVIISVGVGGITFTSGNKIEFKLTHSDVTGSGFDAVTQADVVGVTVGTGGIVRSLVAAHATPSVTLVGYTGRKRFLRLLADFSGDHSGGGTPMAAVVVRGNLDRIAPPA